MKVRGIEIAKLVIDLVGNPKDREDIEAIYRAGAEAMADAQRWVPVAERLPADDYETVLVWGREYDQPNQPPSVWMGCRADHHDADGFDCGDYCIVASHWRELPPGPEVGG